MKKKFFGQFALFGSLVLLVGVLAVVYGLLTRSARWLHGHHDELRSQLLDLSRSPYLLDSERFSELESRLQKGRDFWQNLQDGWAQLGEIPGLSVAKSDLYFGLLDATKRLHAMAEKNRVRLVRGDSFGFSKAVSRGQIPDQILSRLIEDQRRSELLLRLLFESSERDLQFLSLRRETRDEGVLAENPTDFFDVRSAPHFQPIDGCETAAFELHFRCYTGTFLRFLSALTDRQFPVLIRDLTVNSKFLAPHATGNGRWLVLDPQPADFRLLLEWVDYPQTTNQ